MFFSRSISVEIQTDLHELVVFDRENISVSISMTVLLSFDVVFQQYFWCHRSTFDLYQGSHGSVGFCSSPC